MKYRPIWLPAVVAAFTSLVTAQESSAPPSSPPAKAQAPVSIGVVDIDKAAEAYPKAIAERERIQKLQAAYKERLDAYTKQIDQAKSDLALLKDGAPQREELEFEIGTLAKSRDAMAQFLNGRLERELERFELMIYQDLDAAVAAVAKSRGVQIVLRVREVPPPGGAGRDQAKRLAAYDRRNVLYAAEEVDLTPALVKYLQLPAAPAGAKTGDATGKDGKPATGGGS